MLIFLDAETTGLEDDDKICSLGVIYTDGQSTNAIYELVNEGKKISPKASSINHITNEMMQGKATVKTSKVFRFLELHNNETTIIVGHNIQYDMKKLAMHGYKFKGLLIDTLRIAKHLIEEIESYSLQFLRYELKLYRGEEKERLLCGVSDPVAPHHALGDALVVKLLYNYFLDSHTAEEMCTLSYKNVLLQKFQFGKYSGRYIEEIAMNDRGYLEWMLSSLVDLDDDLRYSINYYLEG